MLLTYFLGFLPPECIICEGFLETKDVNFEICQSSFIGRGLPSMTLYFPARYTKPFCISQNPNSMPKCSADQSYVNMKACIAVLYLNDWDIPLLSAFRIQSQGRIGYPNLECARIVANAKRWFPLEMG